MGHLSIKQFKSFFCLKSHHTAYMLVLQVVWFLGGFYVTFSIVGMYRCRNEINFNLINASFILQFNSRLFIFFISFINHSKGVGSYFYF